MDESKYDRQNVILKDKLKECKTQLLSRYFTDHLTNLPNLYQLRKDLQDKSDYGLVNIAIDDFYTINNFYGFIVGDFVIEQVGLFLKKVYQIKFIEFLVQSLHFYWKNIMNFMNLKFLFKIFIKLLMK